MLGALLPLYRCNRLLTHSQNALRVSYTPTAFARQLSTLGLVNRSLCFRDNSQKSPQIHWSPSNSRHISIGSIFSRKPPPTPSPTVVAQITRLEGEANANPHDVAKQLALFQALVDTKLKSSYELVISRWERMCEFVSWKVPTFFIFIHAPRRILNRRCFTLRLPFKHTWLVLSTRINKAQLTLRSAGEIVFLLHQDSPRVYKM